MKMTDALERINDRHKEIDEQLNLAATKIDEQLRLKTGDTNDLTAKLGFIEEKANLANSVRSDAEQLLSLSADNKEELVKAVMVLFGAIVNDSNPGEGIEKDIPAMTLSEFYDKYWDEIPDLQDFVAGIIGDLKDSQSNIQSEVLMELIRNDKGISISNLVDNVYWYELERIGIYRDVYEEALSKYGVVFRKKRKPEINF